MAVIKRMFDLNKIWIDIACPKCKYTDIIQLVDVKTEKIIYCHNCKVSIQLKDSEASSHQATNRINNTLKNIEDILRKFGR